ncbi:MAG TPA: HD domain-containing protein [Gemmataceae bacterium]|nr:HD domain-containing protein [Gemmataceae bacterium]
MTDSVADQYRSLLETVSFAARAHRHQVRKDRETPYAAHPFRVCLIVRHMFGIDDAEFLAAALLHDTLEDTTTDFDDLAERFGTNVAGHVADLSKDTRLPDDKREAAYMATLAAAGPAVKIAKLADIFDNLIDSRHLSATARDRTADRSRHYLEALEKNLPAIAVKPMAIVRQLLSEFTDIVQVAGDE